MKTIKINFVLICLLIFISAWHNMNGQIPLDGNIFEINVIRVENKDIVTSGKIMSLYAQTAKPDEAEKNSKPLITTYLGFENGRFYSPMIPNETSNTGCLYYVSTATTDIVQFQSTCKVYASYFNGGNSGAVIDNMESPLNKPVATWVGTIKDNFLEGTISWDGLDGKRNYYYFSGYSKNN